MPRSFEDLIIVIPGIGGSVLADERGPLWTSGVGSLSAFLAAPETLDVDRALTPIGLIKTFAIVPFLKNIRGYDGLWSRLHTAFNEPRQDAGDPSRRDVSARLVAFP